MNRPFYMQKPCVCSNRKLKPRGNMDERGVLLPFLAGVLVTTPFIFLAKNQNQQPSYAYAGPAMGYSPYMQQPMTYPYMPYSYPQMQYPMNPYIAYAQN